MTNARARRSLRNAPLSSLFPLSALVALVPFVGGGCVTTVEPVGPVPASGPKAPALPWTQRFMTPAVLVADRILIEGPPDLLDHVAIRQEPELFRYTTETTAEGLRQEVVRLPTAGGSEIRAQLDTWSLGALQTLVVLQRPGEVAVTVRAVGNAVCIPTGGAEVEQRAAQLEFRGERP